MKIEISYIKRCSEVITIPEQFEFFFKKDKEDYTDKEWELFATFQAWLMGTFGEDVEIEREVKEL